ncbi:MAG: hypothetical protein A2504_01850 [Bdellovibrionales bacterium RIFOXYD12_FULL_39_22]|nr:MAG: hypothetical protein A2385_04375 [Bdellovibrionales bacterium RIFOXYB1_FULL_39_21]OFZ42350.1 MAG: hypothetical protein A2485_15120 [Bdellovibrionales bacterium RIFOXYC12_FULL_39_17]OFZ46349.1 MAG: hypothetical protein A2404_13895 [Bdellovibrionales bacterium RIFOXYC1_FULL_39_130]OFZ72806.1 MAG: hypothetical protein A2451_13035 [Bdellovibrionales bacterium RIFOXYC2_FULL_39_8]OFZ75242.1 MAG: hypothetical protein A2560_15950 [Bdellovibrionales bacterium RIFOXYD1_FULL_39_84]OFZ93236.1 MAG:
MSIKALICFALVINFSLSFAGEVEQEKLYFKNLRIIAEYNRTGKFSLSQITDAKIFVDALLDYYNNSSSNFQGEELANPLMKQQLFAIISSWALPLEERIRLAAERTRSESYDLTTLFAEVIKNIEDKTISVRAIYLLLNEEELFAARPGGEELYESLRLHNSELCEDYTKIVVSKEIISKELLSEMFLNTPPFDDFMDGRYIDGIRLFMFCRHDRHYPCLKIAKDHQDRPVYVSEEIDELWMQPALGSSWRGLPFNRENGNTPAGVYTIDGVMPSADEQLIFGKYRRLILNHIPASPDESELKKVLTSSMAQKEWWRQSVISRDVGRSLFRIHGTGRINNDPETTHYPFVMTSGCIASREGKYPSNSYKDQRLLLDKLMVAMGLSPIYANEVKIRGVLFVINIDDKKAPVTLADILIP